MYKVAAFDTNKKVLNGGKLTASFCRQVAVFLPAMFCNFYLVKNHKIAYNLATTEARKNKQIFEILRILEIFDASWSKFESYQILLNKISHRFLVTTKLLSG